MSNLIERLQRELVKPTNRGVCTVEDARALDSLLIESIRAIDTKIKSTRVLLAVDYTGMNINPTSEWVAEFNLITEMSHVHGEDRQTCRLWGVPK